MERTPLMAKLCLGGIFVLIAVAIIVVSAATFGSIVPGLLLTAFMAAFVALLLGATNSMGKR